MVTNKTYRKYNVKLNDTTVHKEENKSLSQFWLSLEMHPFSYLCYLHFLTQSKVLLSQMAHSRGYVAYKNIQIRLILLDTSCNKRVTVTLVIDITGCGKGELNSSQSKAL